MRLRRFSQPACCLGLHCQECARCKPLERVRGHELGQEEARKRRHVPVLARLVVVKLVLDHTHDDIVADETSCIHDLLRLHSEFGLARDLVAQQVSGREVAHAELVPDAGSLCTLAYSIAPTTSVLLAGKLNDASEPHLHQGDQPGSSGAVALASSGARPRPSPWPRARESCR